MTMIESSWISFLRQYGPIPRNDNMYDESIHRTLKRKNIVPIIVESVYLEELIENFRSSKPKSVILTGTAGDGKTFNCREIWISLNGSLQIWQNDNKIKELILPNGAKLFVIKDLSELKDEERGILKDFVDSVLNPYARNVFLIAANDGQLIETWKNIDTDTHTESVKLCVEGLLVNEIREKDGFNLRLYNLSQISSARLFPQIVDVVLNHPGWNDCNNCSLKENDQIEKRCPIWENRKRLEGNKDQNLIRSRVTDLLELCELNGVHLPIRQLLLLVSNMLLGHPDARDRIMSCSEVVKIVESDRTSLASIYRNILGENLTERRRESTDVFSTLGRFGIGYETSNAIDNILIFGQDDPDLNVYYNDLVLNDTYYGADQAFRANQKEYLEGVMTDSGNSFLDSLRSQRQRLFFVISREKEEELKLWKLTTFHYAGEFLTDVYKAAQSGRVASHITFRIAQGLNRIFTGLLAKNNDELILATSGSHSQAKVSRIYEESISVPKKRGESMQLKVNDHGKLVIEVRLSSSVEAVELPLQLVRFEFISRVAEGALPGSFSRECYEDILGFKSRLLKQLEIRRKIDGEDTDDVKDLSFRIIRLNQDGIINDKTVEVNYNA
ncbi:MULTISPECIES: hypothetical protein [unclassified Paenibacillus]|uniref:hypothetical protein n=1 Tax=unclassified Paenibacillus TaxID=185978 RepID=UPI0024069829|nr:MULTISPECIES: hypothetical protein [unclassified Paenibacillus]MDF9843746.1 hypothetical protein [Paenibacillus sp. PastF-2]MDF9850415.1 hypothetical protein [Paenibacillus sp. PastM-2]MDF9856882.1 hypothetical protein [Paenibacillus sp. PastF-1]MDH6482261.1 hypothetical protein [Paenibacillus sp. PastH-2]MDH6509575.1 hypothetical protein [Paenibacillus sp. PastM-3]